MSSKPAGNRIHSFISKWYLSEKISLSSQEKLTRSKMSKIEKNKKQIYTISTVARIMVHGQNLHSIFGIMQLYGCI